MNNSDNEKEDKLKFWAEVQKINNLKNPTYTQIDNINSWEYIKIIRNNMILNKDNVESFEPAWEVINKLYGGIFDRNPEDRKKSSDEFMYGETPINEFMYMVSSSFYPSPEYLQVIHDCFQRYFFMGGLESLEDIFFGEEKKRVGNYSAQKQNDQDISYLHGLLRRNDSPYNKIRKIPPLTKLEASELTVQELNLNIDPESLLKKYRRYLKNKAKSK